MNINRMVQYLLDSVLLFWSRHTVKVREEIKYPSIPTPQDSESQQIHRMQRRLF